MSNVLEQIKQNLPDIVTVAREGGLNVKQKGSRYFILCPWHDDKNPSCELYPKQNKGYCHACKKRFDVIDLWAYFNNCGADEAIKRLTEQFGLSRQEEGFKRDFVCAYDYKDERGNLIFQVCRYMKNNKKTFTQRRPDGKNGWLYNLQGVEPVPYRLPELVQAIERKETIYIAEGEKDVLSLVGVGLPATCNSGGAGHWTDKHSTYFPAGCEVVILPDNDEPGRKHAQSVAEQLCKRGCRVKVVELPGLPLKGDISDWLGAGHNKEELLQLIKQTPEYGNEDWPEPEPIDDNELLPVEHMTSDIIPDGLRDWLTDIAYRMQCPLEFVAVGAIVALSSLIGAGCSVRPKQNDDWEVIPNLWGAVVGRPSMLKSPSLAEAMRPLSLLEKNAKEQFEEEQRYAAAKLERYKAIREALRQELLSAAKGKAKRDMEEIEMELATLEEPVPACRRRHKTNDTTVEKLGELLAENPRGLLIFRDELVGLLSSWEREDRQADRAFFLEAWNGGQSFITDRIFRGTIDIQNCCLSILGGIQPSKLQAFLIQSAGNLNNDGMVQRFQLMVFPDEPTSWKLVDERPDVAAKQKAYAIFGRLADIDFVKDAGAMQDGNGRPYFKFDAEAQKIFYEWLTELENKVRQEDNPLMGEHLTKYRSLVPSLALIFHLVDGGTGLIPSLPVAMACEWADFLEQHARRVYGLISNSGAKSAALLAKKIKRGDVKGPFTLRDVYKNHWHLLDAPGLVRKACDELEEAGWIRKNIMSETGGRPKATYTINPKIYPKT